MATAADYATTRLQETDQSAMMTEARKALARQQAAGYPTQPLNVTGMQQPTMQQRDMATGQMGPALYAQERQTTTPTLSAARPATGIQSIGQQPVIGPVTPGQPSQPSSTGYDFAGLRNEIDAFGPAPTMDDAYMAKLRAQESLRLMNIQKASENELGAAAASSGALLGGDVRSLAADLAAQRIAGETDFGVKLLGQKLAADQANYNSRLGLAGSLAQQRAQNAFTKEEAELDRRARAGEALSDREWRSLEAARDRAQQTSERLGGQQFTDEQRTKQNAFAGDENAKDRLQQLTLAEKQIEATTANLEAQLAQARSENNLDRVQQLEVQRRDLVMQRNQMRQQNDQFLASIGLDRQRFDEATRQFDLTRGDQVDQFAQNLQQQGSQFDRQLLQNFNLANMDDRTRRYVAELNDRYNRDLNASTIDPTTWQTILSAAGSLAPILQGLGISGSDIVGGIKSVFGGGGGETPGGGAPGTGGFGLKDAIVGAGGAALLYSSFNDPIGLSRTAKSIAGGAAVGSVIPGVGTLIGAGVGAFVSAFGPGARARAKTAFTTSFDNMYRGLESGGALNADPSDPNSIWRPENRLALVSGMGEAIRESSRQGVGDVEISDPDWQRMQRLGIAAPVQGSDRSRYYAIDDPRLIAMLGPGDPTQFFDFKYDGQNNDNVFATAEGSMQKFIETGGLKVFDKITGQQVDFNNPEEMKAIAARNNPTGGVAVAISGQPQPWTGTRFDPSNNINPQQLGTAPPKQPVGVA